MMWPKIESISLSIQKSNKFGIFQDSILKDKFIIITFTDKRLNADNI